MYLFLDPNGCDSVGVGDGGDSGRPTTGCTVLVVVMDGDTDGDGVSGGADGDSVGGYGGGGSGEDAVFTNGSRRRNYLRMLSRIRLKMEGR